MKRGLRAILLLTAVVLTVLGSGLLFAPELMARLYGTNTSVEGTNAGRTAGAAIIALGALAWLTKQHATAKVQAVGIPVLFVWFVAKSGVAYWAVRNAVFDPVVGRTVLVFDLLLAVLYGRYLVALFRSTSRDG